MGIVIRGPWPAPGKSRQFVAIRQMIDEDLEAVDRRAGEVKETAKSAQPKDNGTQ